MAKSFTCVKIGVLRVFDAERVASEACDNGWTLVSIGPYGGSAYVLITIRHTGPGAEPLPPLPKDWLAL